MRYLGPQALTTIARVVTAAAILLATAVYLYGEPPAVVPRSTIVIYWLLCLLFIGGLRVLMRHYFNDVQRSEEHTSELQSLMRISYAVFCLKKKKHNEKIKST